MKIFSAVLTLTLSLTLSLIFPLALAGCGEQRERHKPNGDQPDSAVAKKPAESKTENFTLQYRFLKGESFRYRLTTTQLENVQIENKDTSIQNNAIQQETYVMNFQVDEVQENNTAELTCSITSVKSETEINGNKFTYQTGQAANENELKNFARFESFRGNPFGIKLSGSGDVVEINRLENILNRFISINKIQDTITQATKEIYRRDLREAMLRPLLMQIFRKFPEETMGIDSVWTIPQPPMPLTPMVLKNTLIFKITGKETSGSDTAAVIEGEMKTEVSGQRTMTDQGVQFFFDKPRTNASAKIHFSLTRGIILRSKSSTLLEHSFISEASTPQGQLRQTNRRRLENTMQVESL